MSSKFQNVFFAVLILIFMPLMAGAETWVDPTCAPPNCNVNGPIWSSPDSGQESASASTNPVIYIDDTRTSGVPVASISVESALTGKPAIYANATASGSYAGYFDADANPGIYVAGGLKFEGIGGNPGYPTEGLLYYHNADDLFKFYNGSTWVDLGIQWSVAGDELYHAFAVSGTGQGVGIKSGDATDPNDDYNLDIYRKALSVDDKALYSRLEMVDPSTRYASGTLGGYINFDSSDHLAGVIGKADVSSGVGVYGEGGRGGHFETSERLGYGLVVKKRDSGSFSASSAAVYVSNDHPGGYGITVYANSTSAPVHGGYFSTKGGSQSAAVYGSTNSAGGTITYGGHFYSDSSEGYGVWGSSYKYGVYGLATNIGGDTYENYGGYFEGRGYDGYGAYAKATGTNGIAVRGEADNVGTELTYGGYFTAASDAGIGVYGNASATSGLTNYGGYFEAAGDTGRAVYGTATGVLSIGGEFDVYGDASTAVRGWSFATGDVTNAGGNFAAGGNSGIGLIVSGPTPTADTVDALSLSLGGHPIAMKELDVSVSPPSTKLVYGKFYVKTSDHLPYFLASTGTEYGLTSGGSGTIADGTAEGQLTYWDNTGGTWAYTDTSELVWDDTNGNLGIGVASPTSINRLHVVNSDATADSVAVYGDATSTSVGTKYGVYGTSASGYGVYGSATTAGGVVNQYGGYFEAAANQGTGVFGYASATSTTTNYGVKGMAGGGYGTAVRGIATASGVGVINSGGSFLAYGDQGTGVGATAMATGAVTNYGGKFQAKGDSGIAVYAEGPDIPTTTALALKLDNGAMAMEELATLPTNTTNYGKFYVKSSDHLPYFLSGDGVTPELSLTGGGSGTIEDGSSNGQVAYWDNTAGEWKHTSITEFVYNDTNKNVGIGVGTPSADNALTVSHDGPGYSTGIYAVAGGSDLSYGGRFYSSGAMGAGVRGEVSAAGTTSGMNYGGYFISAGVVGAGVYGKATATTGTGSTSTFGGYFMSSGDHGIGAYGSATATGAVTNYGGKFYASGDSGIGVYAAGPNVPTTTALALKLDNGAMAMEELATLPEVTTNYGKFYVKSSDHLPYFLSGDGVTGELSLTGGGSGTIEDGTADGQFSYWDDTAGEWKHTDTSDLYWNVNMKNMGIGVASPTSTKLHVVNDGTYGDVAIYGSASETGAVENTGVAGGASGDTGRGVSGLGAGLTGIGVYGVGNYYGGVGTTNYGGYFTSDGSTGIGIYGNAINSGVTIANYGASFTAAGGQGVGVKGVASSPDASNTHYGGYFTAATGAGIGLYTSGASESARFEGAEVVISDGTESKDYIPASSAGWLYVGHGLEVDGSIYAATSVQAPAFYDIVNTTYYLDPGNAGTSLNVAGNILVGTSDAADEDFIYFDDGITEYMKWDNAATRFEFSDEVYATSMASPIYYGTSTTYYVDPDSSVTSANFGGDIRLGAYSATDDDYIYFDAAAEYFMWDTDNGSYDGEVAGIFKLTDDLMIGSGITTDDGYLYFDNGYDSLKWDDADTRFEFSDDLYVALDLITGSDVMASANMYVDYNSNSSDDYIYFGRTTSTEEYMKWDEGMTRFEFSDTIYAEDNVGAADDFFVGYGSTTDNDSVFFDITAEYFRWENTNSRFYLSDDLYVYGNYSSLSDRRLKKNIKDIDSALKIINDLEPVSFDWKEDGKSAYGFIAQDMYGVLPELVHKPIDEDLEDDYWGVDYSKMTAILTAAMQEQQAEIEELQEKAGISSDSNNDEVMDYIKSLESRIEDLESKLDQKEEVIEDGIIEEKGFWDNLWD